MPAHLLHNPVQESSCDRRIVNRVSRRKLITGETLLIAVACVKYREGTDSINGTWVIFNVGFDPLWPYWYYPDDYYGYGSPYYGYDVPYSYDYQPNDYDSGDYQGQMYYDQDSYPDQSQGYYDSTVYQSQAY